MLKKVLVDMACRSRLHRLFAPWFGGHTSIILLHRVHPGPAKGMPSDNLQLTPEFLDNFIRQKQGSGWRFISLDYLVEHFDECVERKKNLVVTLDDGYRDNFDYAWPVFQKHGVPFTVYLANAFPNGTADFWWYTLEELLATHGKAQGSLELACGAARLTLDANDPAAACAAFKGFYQPLGQAQQQEVMARLLARYPLAPRQQRLWMDWEEIRELAQQELCTIGCHTLSHRSLAALSRQEARDEMGRSRQEIEREIGRPVRHFAYPFGRAQDAGKREEAIARELGFLTAVTTRIGNLHPGHRDHLLMLPRIPLYQGGKNGKLSEIFQSGMYSALANRFRKVVTY
jgi:peptidoglycan/xylan/chitin deacetylase (PgdA/CDA1 family)